MFPRVSYTARIELDESNVALIMSIRYPGCEEHQISWSANVFPVNRLSDGTLEYLPGGTHSSSEHTYPSHIDAIEAGVAHYTRAASVSRGAAGS